MKNKCLMVTSGGSTVTMTGIKNCYVIFYAHQKQSQSVWHIEYKKYWTETSISERCGKAIKRSLQFRETFNYYVDDDIIMNCIYCDGNCIQRQWVKLPFQGFIVHSQCLTLTCESHTYYTRVGGSVEDEETNAVHFNHSSMILIAVSYLFLLRLGWMGRTYEDLFELGLFGWTSWIVVSSKSSSCVRNSTNCYIKI